MKRMVIDNKDEYLSFEYGLDLQENENAFKNNFSTDNEDNNLSCNKNDNEFFVFYTGLNSQNNIFNIIGNINNEDKKVSRNNKDIFLIQKVEKNPINIELKKLGRKKLNDKAKGEHNKNTGDNIIKKIINIIKKSVLNCINKKIKSFGKNEMTLKSIKPVIRTVDENKQLLDKKLRDLFSSEKSKRFKKVENDYNKKIINILLKDEDNTIRNSFNSLFNLKFSDCLLHFRKQKMYLHLNGMEDIDDILEKFNDEEYKKNFKKYVFDFENIINKKIGRNKNNKHKKDKKMEQ